VEDGSGDVVVVDDPVIPVRSSVTWCYYTVKAGDTLSGIGYSLGIYYSRLASWNNIANPNKIITGQVLKYQCDQSEAASAVSVDESSPTPVQSGGGPQPVTSSQTCVYTVQSGDSLSAIADSLGVSMDVLVSENGISNPNYIYVGQEISYPCDGGDGGGGGEDSGSHQLDQAGINLIKGFEGWSACYYNDAAGYGTIGYGHLVKSGDPYAPGSCISEQDGENLLASDAAGFVNCVNAMQVALNQNQFDALVSFAYNLGCGNLAGVQSLLQAGNYAGVCGEIEQYVHAGGQVLAGLVSRRQQECALFNS